MVRATYIYNADALEALLDTKGWTNSKVANACGFSPEHIANILNGVTLSSRRDTKVKFVNGLKMLGASEREANSVYNQTSSTLPPERATT